MPTAPMGTSRTQEKEEALGTQHSLENAYDRGTFGISRRTFVELAAAAGITAVGGALVFPNAQAQAKFTEPAQASWPSLTDSGKVRFTVHSDTHIGSNTNNNWADKVPAAFKAIYEICPDIDAHFFVGDSADTGAPKQYDELADLLNDNAQAPVGIVMGNHEYYYWMARANNDGTGPTQGYWREIAPHVTEVTDPSYEVDAQDEFCKFVDRKLKVEGSFQIPGGPNAGEIDCDFVVGGDGTPGSGYHVIAASPRVGGYDHSFYGDTLDWIREHLAAAAQEDPNKPIFLLTHHPFGNTVWYSVGGSWNGQFGEDISETEGNDNAFYHEIAAQYPQLIHFSGHTHVPMVDPRSIYQDDGCTLVQTATFANNFWMIEPDYDEAGSYGGHPDSGQDASQCELVEIDTATNEVTIYRLDFREGAVLGQPWTVDASRGADDLQYTTDKMEAASAAPVVDSDAQVTVTGGSDGVSFAITADKVRADTAALPNDVVLAYRVEVHEGDASGEVDYDARYMSDYYKASADRAASFERPLFGSVLKGGRDYTLVAFAVNAFGKESKVGEASFSLA